MKHLLTAIKKDVPISRHILVMFESICLLPGQCAGEDVQVVESDVATAQCQHIAIDVVVNGQRIFDIGILLFKVGTAVTVVASHPSVLFRTVATIIILPIFLDVQGELAVVGAVGSRQAKPQNVVAFKS